MTDSKIKSALDAAGTAADYSARATYQRGYDAGVESSARATYRGGYDAGYDAGVASVEARANAAEELAELYRRMGSPSQADLAEVARERDRHASKTVKLESRAEAAESREWALGGHVVAQAQRLRLADNLAKASRNVLNEVLSAIADDAGHDEPWFVCPHGDLIDALAAWDTVPGDDKETA